MSAAGTRSPPLAVTMVVKAMSLAIPDRTRSVAPMRVPMFGPPALVKAVIAGFRKSAGTALV